MANNHYESLSSEKYFAHATKQQTRLVRRQRNREALSTAFWAAVGLGFLAGAVYTMPTWTAFLSDYVTRLG